MLAVDQVAAVELGRHMYGQLAIAQRGVGRVGIRRGGGEIAAHREEHLAAAIAHRLDRADHVHAVFARRLEAEDLAQPVEQGRRWLLVDAHRAVALHVAVPAYRADARAGPADVAAQQHQVHQHLDRGHRPLVLGDAHAPADDRAPGSQEALAGIAQACFGQAGFVFDLAPIGSLHAREQCIEALGMGFDEGLVEQWRLAFGMRARASLQ